MRRLGRHLFYALFVVVIGTTSYGCKGERTITCKSFCGVTIRYFGSHRILEIAIGTDDQGCDQCFPLQSVDQVMPMPRKQ